MIRLIKRAWEGLLKSYDVYIVILIALALSVLGIRGTASIPLVLSGTLATLAIIAFGLLKNRQTDEAIEKSLDRMSNNPLGASALEFFKEEWDEMLFQQRMETAKELSILAHANHEFISRNEERFGEFIQDGGKIRYIILEPTGEAMQLFANRSGGAEKSLAQACLQIMSKLAMEGTSGGVEIKLINHLPSAIVTMIDPNTKGGVIFVSLCGFNQFFLSRPGFVLHKNRDGKVFEFYQTYFENLWNWEGSKPFKVITKAVASQAKESTVVP